MTPLLLLTLAAGPLTPADERASFRLAPGFSISLAAAEPDVVDPVAACFDAAGRLYVCEMRGYPNGGVGTGPETRGCIRRLEDRDGDGVYETATTFADGLRFPMGIAPYRGGFVVAVAPDLVYLEDTDGDGKADVRRVLYTGFATANIQQMASSLTWGLDNRLHGVAGLDGGTVRSVEKPDAPPVALRGRGFRLDPGAPGSLEPESGGGQYGLCFDPFGRAFTATNSQHLRQILLPDHALRRSPNVPVPAVTADIPDHGAACRVYRISPFEGWRVERTARRAGNPADSRRFPSTELSPGGYVTSACSPLVWGDTAFVCDPANNLVHRDRLDFTAGAAAVARRIDDGCEVLASTDNWFRPVSLVHAPDGSVLVLDFYREVIETPLSLPDDIRKRLNLESRDRGRIWRLTRTDAKPAKCPDLSNLSDMELAAKVSDSAVWVRGTARRLLVERKSVAKEIAFGVRRGTDRLPDMLATFDGLGLLADKYIVDALADAEPGNRGFALRLAEPRLAASKPLRDATAKLVADPSVEVRFQLALAAGGMSVADAVPLLATLAATTDPWVQSAVLLSARDGIADLVTTVFAADPSFARPLLSRATAAVAGDPKAVERLITAALPYEAELPAVLEALPKGFTHPGLAQPFARAAAVCRSATPTVAAARLLAHAPPAVGREPLLGLLKPGTPEEVQRAAVAALPGPAEPLLAAWPTLGPAARRAVQEVVVARPDRVAALLTAVEAGRVAVADLDPARVTQLRAHRDPALRARAIKLFPDPAGSDRAAVAARYATAGSGGDAARGKAVFAATCAGCHQLDGAGHAVGPDLRATVPGKSDADLAVAVFDPNREIDPRYVSYVAELADGRQATGLLAADGPGHLTLRRADGAEEVIRRADLDHLRSSGRSLMPDGLETTLPPAAFADLLTYLRAATRPKADR